MTVVQHTVLLPDGVTPMRNAWGSVGVVGVAVDTSGNQIADVQRSTTDANGLASVTLAPIAAPSYYVWTNPARRPDEAQQFAIRPPASGTVSMLSCVINPLPPVGPDNPAVSQAQLAAALAGLGTGSGSNKTVGNVVTS